MLIAIEGIDASGKDTVAANLATWLGAEVVNFPNEKDTVTGAPLRAYLRGEWTTHNVRRAVVGGAEVSAVDVNTDLSALAFQSMMIVNRIETLKRIEAFQLSGVPVVLVRYWQSGVVYGAHDGLAARWLEESQAFLPRAHLNLLLDVDASTAMLRRSRRDGAYPAERYEAKQSTLNAIRYAYLDLWRKHGALGSGRDGDNHHWRIVDANASQDNVLADVQRHVAALQRLY